MEIPSSFSSGLAGLKGAQSGLTQATVDVAKPSQPQASEAGSTETSNPVSATDKTSSLVSAIESKNQGEAAVEVLETANETLGTVIDIKV